MKRPYHARKKQRVYLGRGNGKRSKTTIEREAAAPYHPDKTWIDNKILGHGGAYGWNKGSQSCAYINYIGNKSKLQIFFYNCILFCKWLRRKYGRSK